MENHRWKDEADGKYYDREYTDDNFQISSGFSVIIKRVPAGSVHCDMACNGSFAGFGMKDTNKVNSSCPMNVEINFDNFGVDLCPVLEASLSCSDCIRALRAVHSRFYLSRITIAMGIVGPGLIGTTLLDQLSGQVHYWICPFYFSPCQSKGSSLSIYWLHGLR